MEAGRTAVITGGASGIGLAVARKCIAIGMNVTIADLNADRLAQAELELNAGSRVMACQCDVSSLESMQSLKDSVYKRFGEVGFLFLNAGLSVGSSAYTTPMSDWQLQLGVNLYGVLHGLSLFAPTMIEQGTDCRIVATSSYAGLLNTSTLGIGAGTPYTVSKHAVTLSMEAMAHELRSKPACKVTAHILCPAAVSTQYMATSIELNAHGDSARVERQLGAVQAMQQAALTPEGIAQVLFDGLQANQFYILGYDEQQPKEMLRAMLQMRVDDIKNEGQPLSHLLRDDAGKAKRSSIKNAIAKGAAALKEANTKQGHEDAYWRSIKSAQSKL